MADDPQKYRVNLMCACKMDLAYGYGATVAEARGHAVAAFRRHHGKKGRWTEEIVEHAVPHRGGSHYEELTPSEVAAGP